MFKQFCAKLSSKHGVNLHTKENVKVNGVHVLANNAKVEKCFGERAFSEIGPTGLSQNKDAIVTSIEIPIVKINGLKASCRIFIMIRNHTTQNIKWFTIGYWILWLTSYNVTKSWKLSIFFSKMPLMLGLLNLNRLLFMYIYIYIYIYIYTYNWDQFHNECPSHYYAQ